MRESVNVRTSPSTGRIARHAIPGVGLMASRRRDEEGRCNDRRTPWIISREPPIFRFAESTPRCTPRRSRQCEIHIRVYAQINIGEDSKSRSHFTRHGKGRRRSFFPPFSLEISIMKMLISGLASSRLHSKIWFAYIYVDRSELGVHDMALRSLNIWSTRSLSNGCGIFEYLVRVWRVRRNWH